LMSGIKTSWRTEEFQGQLIFHGVCWSSKIALVIPDKDSKIIVYCGVDLRGPLATKTLNDMGYKNAVNMIGGLKAWKMAGYPLSK
jgi:rhodanese-related sulfurtransferase